jgi:glycosyltransferase involved in cell wall biosynthesis
MTAEDFPRPPNLREGFGTSIIELTESEPPTVASRIHGATDALANGETGELIAPHNVSELEKGLNELLSNDCLKFALGIGIKARARSKVFRISRKLQSELRAFDRFAFKEKPEDELHCETFFWERWIHSYYRLLVVIQCIVSFLNLQLDLPITSLMIYILIQCVLKSNHEH